MDKIEWSIKVPIFKNPLILKQLGFAIGIPFGVLILVLFLVTKELRYTLYALALILALFLFSYLLILLVYGGKYELGFRIDQEGVASFTEGTQKKKNKILNTLTIMMGVFSKQPTIAGAGFLADARQTVFLKWKRIKKVKYDERSRTILLYGGFGESIGVFCNQDNYEEGKAYLKSKV